MQLKYWKICVVLLVMILFIAGNLYMIFHKESKIPRFAYVGEMDDVRKTNLKETVETVGVTVPADYQTIHYNPNLGVVDQILVKKGQKVEPGTPLLQYESSELEKEKKQLELKKKRIQEQSKKLEEDVWQYEALKSSLQSKDLEEELMEAELQRIDLNINEAKYTKNLLDIELEDVESQITTLNEKMEQLVVESNVSGIVEKISHNVNEPLITISSIPPVIEGKIQEEQTVKLNLGQKTLVKVPAIQNKLLTGSILDISELPLREPDIDKKSFYPFTIQLDEPTDQLRIGYHVNITIITKEKNGAIVVPDKAVWKEGKKSFVFVIHNGVLEKRKVKLGMKSGQKQEVVEGVTEKEWVIVQPSTWLKEGMAVITPIHWERINKKTLNDWSKKEMLKYMIHGFIKGL
jgi:HlyD family secretion protein